MAPASPLAKTIRPFEYRYYGRILNMAHPGESPLRSIRRYQVAFFGVTLGCLALIQTPVMVWVFKVVATPQQAEVWATTLRSNTPGILLALLVGLYIDVTRARISQLEQRELRENIQRKFAKFEEVVATEPLNRVPDEELIYEGLRRHLGQGATRVDELVRGLMGKASGNPPMHGYHAEHVFRDSDDPQYFEVDCRFIMTWAIGIYTVVIVGGDELARDYLYKSGSRVSDVIYVPGLDDGAFDKTVQLFRDTYKASYLPYGQSVRRVTLKPTELVGELKAAALGSNFPGDSSRVAVFVLDIPESRESLIITHTMRASMNVPAFYWNFPIPTYVAEIKFDLRNLRAADPLKYIGFTTFLPCASDIYAEMEGRIQRVMVDNWILPGHGLILVWTF
jgi:hypothetical protein